MGLFVILGVVFGAFAGLSAFLIIYVEYSKHKLARRRLWRESLSMAGIAFLVFLGMAIGVGYLLIRSRL